MDKIISKKENPSRYEKGIQTRDLLYQVSKELFYKYGYEKTRIKDITETADVPIGLFTYYFKTKDNIVAKMRAEYYYQIESYLNTLSIKGMDNSIYSHALLSQIFFNRILYDENNRRFYYEILKKSSIYEAASQFIPNVYRQYIEDYNLVISEQEFENLLYVDFGGRREYFLNYFEKPLNDSTEDLVYLLNGIMPRLLGIDQNTISTLIRKGIQMAKTIDSSHIHYLCEPSKK